MCDGIITFKNFASEFIQCSYETKISSFTGHVSMKTFNDLSMHQKLKFLHDLAQRIEPILPKRDFSLISVQHAEEIDLLRMNNFFRCLAWSQSPENIHSLQPIYKKLYPQDPIRLPDSLRCKSILMLLTIRIFNQYLPRVSEDKLIDSVSKAMQIWNSLYFEEIQLLHEIIEFESEKRILLFKFQKQKFKCHLNPSNGLGYELTLQA